MSTPIAASSSSIFIGLMSGTSLDGVDAVLAALPAGAPMTVQASAYIPFPAELKAELLALQSNGADEIRREALAANALAQHYAECVAQLLADGEIDAAEVCAVGVHGQTIRHRPELGFTRQTNNPALLAELCGIDVIADFRSRDVAAGGQGAPLVPAFHRAVFGSDQETRVVVNIGGISNISILSAQQSTSGFDTGPGNVLMDAWTMRHQQQPYDRNGAWAATGQCHPALLASLRDEPFLRLPPPKSTGRDLFHIDWLDARLAPFSGVSAADVQATLTAFTATTIADAILTQAADADKVYVCGGGAYNQSLMLGLQQALHAGNSPALVCATAALGVPPNEVEALAFAWLAQRFLQRLPGNLPAVTGARGLRVLGALYPA